MSHSISEVAKKLKAATNFTMVFGVLPAGTPETQHVHAKKQFAAMARIVHPDHALGFEKEATDAFRMLDIFWKAAQASIKDQTYSKKSFPAGSCTVEAPLLPETVFSSPTATYKLVSKPFNEGDFSVIYKGKTEPGNMDVLVKVALAPDCNSLLEHEARLLKRFSDAPKGSKLAGVNKFIPRLLDTFVIPDGKGKRFRANVIPFLDGYYSITDLKNIFPTGLDPKHVAWIGRRNFALVAAASLAETVHGTIVPDHVLVHPISHDPIHIGWTTALDRKSNVKNRITMVIDRWKDWYPPEVFKKEAQDTRTDIYMAGKTIIYLLGGDTHKDTIPRSVPAEFAQIVLKCVERDINKRPKTGGRILDDFTKVLEKLWGRAYRVLEIPKH